MPHSWNASCHSSPGPTRRPSPSEAPADITPPGEQLLSLLSSASEPALIWPAHPDLSEGIDDEQPPRAAWQSDRDREPLWRADGRDRARWDALAAGRRLGAHPHRGRLDRPLVGSVDIDAHGWGQVDLHDGVGVGVHYGLAAAIAVESQ